LALANVLTKKDRGPDSANQTWTTAANHCSRVHEGLGSDSRQDKAKRRFGAWMRLTRSLTCSSSNMI